MCSLHLKNGAAASLSSSNVSLRYYRTDFDRRPLPPHLLHSSPCFTFSRFRSFLQLIPHTSNASLGSIVCLECAAPNIGIVSFRNAIRGAANIERYAVLVAQHAYHSV